MDGGDEAQKETSREGRSSSMEGSKEQGQGTNTRHRQARAGKARAPTSIKRGGGPSACGNAMGGTFQNRQLRTMRYVRLVRLQGHTVGNGAPTHGNDCHQEAHSSD